MFRDRIDAGEKLSKMLQHYKRQKNACVIGLPRGGIPVAYEVAQSLQLPLDLVSPRKIGAPFNKEFAIGAITETGEGIFDEGTIDNYSIPQEYIQREVEIEKKIAQDRLNKYRGNRPPRDVSGKTVILVDDGIATGSTMKAAIKSLQKEGAGKIVVAVPVAPPDAFEKMQELADEFVCIDTPLFFQAVGQFYEDFGQTEDAEVIEIMKMCK